MSFMFNPFPYDDPNAVNRISAPDVDLSTVLSCPNTIKNKIAEAAKSLGRGIIAIDGYATAPFIQLCELAAAAAADAGLACRTVDTRTLSRPS